MQYIALNDLGSYDESLIEVLLKRNQSFNESFLSTKTSFFTNKRLLPSEVPQGPVQFTFLLQWPI